jgi:hypothetical protein
VTRRSSSPPVGGALLALLLLHLLALLAAATRLANRAEIRFDKGAVSVPGFVPPRASLLVAAALLVAYGVAFALLYTGSPGAWWYCAALAGAGLAYALSDGRDWLPTVAVLVLLVLPSVRRDLI